jgi:hypothetical protein
VGVTYDTRASVVSAHAVAAGMAPATSRDALRATFAPASDQVRTAVERECRALLADRAVGRVADFTPGEVDGALAAAIRLVTDERGLDVGIVAQLLAMVQDERLRDLVWCGFDRSSAELDLEIWAQVTRDAPDRWLAPAGFLAGFAAWLSGSGVLASHAVERVHAVVPGYPAAVLLGDALRLGLDPAGWEGIRARVIGSS